MATSGVNAYWLPTAEMYQKQASQAGIEVNVRVVPANGYWTDTWMVHNFAQSWWIMRQADQILNLQFRCGGRFAETSWCNDEFEGVMEESRRAVDFERRRELYQRAQEIQAEDGGMIAPFFVNDMRALSTRLQGLPADTIWQEVSWHAFTVEP